MDKIRRLVRQLDGAALEKLFRSRSGSRRDLGATAVKEVIHSGVLILRHRTAEEICKRDKFVSILRRLVSEYCSSDEIALLSKHLQEAALIETGFAEILRSLESASITSLGPAFQAWALLDRIATEYRILYERAFSPPANGDKQTVLLDARGPLIKDNTGSSVRAEAVSNNLGQFLASTLQMLALQNEWFQGGELVLPPRVPTTEDMRFKAGSHLYLASAWDALRESSETLRFFGGTTQEITSSKGNRRAIVFDLDLAPLLFFHIAGSRDHQIQLQSAMEYLPHARGYKFKNPEEEIVGLPPEAFVSIYELIAVTLLDAEYHYPMERDDPIAGLSLRQWLRGYAVLKRVFCSETDAGNFQATIVEIERQRIERALTRGGLSREQSDIFIASTTFGRNKRDLWDAPLLRTADGKLFFMAPLFATADLIAIVVSQLASQQLQIPSKGDAFETRMLEEFTSAGISAKGFDYLIDGEKYQCDVAVLWEGHLFVIECKNYLLPPDSAAMKFHFLSAMDEAALQASRIASHLRTHPEIVAEAFGSDSTYTEVSPVVLNAMPFQCAPRNGAYFYDGSALSRFLSSGDLNLSQTVRVEGRPVQVKHRFGTLWEGTSPSASDFVRQLQNPFQSAVEMGLWSSKPFIISLSREWILATPRLQRQESSIAKTLETAGWSSDGIEKFKSLFQEFGETLDDRDE